MIWKILGYIFFIVGFFLMAYNRIGWSSSCFIISGYLIHKGKKNEA